MMCLIASTIEKKETFLVCVCFVEISFDIYDRNAYTLAEIITDYESLRDSGHYL